MNLQTSLLNIGNLMAKFVTEIKAHKALGLNDINKLSESVLIPVFAVAYGYRNLRNLNTEQENYPAIDLGDEKARVAFQVTSETDSKKVKETLRKFVKYGLYEIYGHLIIYIITEKQRSYTGIGYGKIINGNFSFNKDKDIRDYRNLLSHIKTLPIEKIIEIEQILEKHFGNSINGRIQPQNYFSLPKQDFQELNPLSSQQEQLRQIQTYTNEQQIRLSVTNEENVKFGGALAPQHITSIPFEDSIPTPPQIYAPRKNLVKNLLAEFTETKWLSLVDGPGKGKTQLARDIATESQLEIKWVSIQGELNSNPLAHFRAQLMSWLVKLSKDVNLWVPYFNGQINSADIAQRIANLNANKGILVVDDLPPQSLLNEELDLIASIFSQSGVKILTTSKFPLPSTLQSKHKIVMTDVPRFEQADFVDMLKCANAPDYAFNPRFIGLLMAEGITDRIPTLASVTIDWLERNNWKLDAENFDSIMLGKPVELARQTTRNQILRLLESAPKELLYRLSLSHEPFNRQLALQIAQVTPSIQYAGENFERLTSPWLEKLGDDRFQVTSYLRSSGSDNLPKDVQKNVHDVIATYFLQGGSVHIDQVANIARHLLLSEQYTDYAAFWVNFMVNGIKDSSQAKYAEQITLITYHYREAPWPESVDLYWRVMFRSGQVRVRLLAGGDATELNSDLDQLIASATAEHLSAAFVAHGILSVGLFGVKNQQANQIKFQHATKFVQVVRTMQNSQTETLFKESTEKNLFDLVTNMPDWIEEIFWLTASDLEGIEQKKLFLYAISAMNHPERELLFSNDLSIEYLFHIIDEIWVNEADKQKDQQDWETILNFLDEVKQIGELPGAFPLQVIQARARAIVLADYLAADCNEALVDLHSLTLIEHPTLTFLYNYTVGHCLFLTQDENALKYINAAVEYSGEQFSYMYLQAWQINAVLQSKLGNWSKAREFCLRAIQLAKSEPEVAKYERLDMKGELAWIYWSQGSKQKACRSMVVYALGLIQCHYDPNNSRFRESFNKAAHAVGWFVAVSGTGSPPPYTKSGEVYMDIFPGWFAVRNDKLGNYIQPMGFSRTLLLQQIALFAEQVKLERLAWKLYCLLDSLEEDCPNPFIVGMRYISMVELATQFSTPANAIVTGIRAVRSWIIGQGLRSNNMDIYNTQISIDVCINSIDHESRKKIEHGLTYTLFLPFIVNTLGSSLTVQEAFSSMQELKQSFDHERSSFYDPAYWEQTLAFFNQLVEMWDGQNHITEDNLILPEEHSFFRAIWYLLASKKRGLTLSERLSKQIQAIFHFADYSKYSRHLWQGLSKFLHNYWSAFPGFSLHSPQEFRSDLNLIPKNQREKTCAKIILRAIRATGVKLDQVHLTKLEKIASDGLY